MLVELVEPGTPPASPAAVLGQLAAFAVLIIAVMRLPARITHERRHRHGSYSCPRYRKPSDPPGTRTVLGVAPITAATVPLLVPSPEAWPVTAELLRVGGARVNRSPSEACGSRYWFARVVRRKGRTHGGTD